MAKTTGNDAQRAEYFRDQVNARAQRLGKSMPNTYQLETMFHIWKRSRWAPLHGDIADVLKRYKDTGKDATLRSYKVIDELGADVWLVQTAERHAMTPDELRAALEAKIVHWIAPGQQLPDATLHSEAMVWMLKVHPEVDPLVMGNGIPW